MTTVQKIFYSGEDYENDCYLFAPSISRRKTVSGKTYYSADISAAARISEKRWNLLP